MADDFDGDHEAGHQRVADETEAHVGAGELLQVADAAFGEALDVVVKKRSEREAGRDWREHRGRFEGRDDADEVGEQDEQEDGAEEGQVLPVMVVDVVVRLVVQKPVDAFEGMLQAAGTVHGKFGTEEGEEDDDKRRDDELHRHIVRPGTGLFRLTYGGENRVGDTRQVIVKQGGHPEFMFVHKGVGRGFRG